MKKIIKIMLCLLYAIGLLQFNVYGLQANVTENDILDDVLNKAIQVDPVYDNDNAKIILPDVEEDYKISIFGSSNEAVVTKDGTVFTPLQDMNVNIFYEVEDQEGNKKHSDVANKVRIMGKYNVNDSKNKKPNVVPGLREWFGNEGQFQFNKNLVISDNSLHDTATIIAMYFNEMAGYEVNIKTGGLATGDIFLKLDDNTELGSEGYEMEIGDILNVTAPTEKGILYAGTSITQILSQAKDKLSINKGLVRDYPQYPVRSTMLDIARFYMPFDYLKEITRYAAYFKLNEIHLHINDVGGEQDAAFRVESKKYPQLNSHTRGEVYSQDKYRDYQQEMKSYGIDVITEIDTPAHAGAFGLIDEKYMKDSFHLDVDNPESVALVKDVISEFIGGDNPVVKSKKFHIGTDEYDRAYSESVRKYMDELITFVNDKGYETRMWASLGKGGFEGSTPVNKNATAHLWNPEQHNWREMIVDGYNFINNIYSYLYTVPGGFGGYVNYENTNEHIYDSWEVTNLGYGDTLEAGHPQLLGSETSIWYDENALYSEFDYFKSVKNQITLMSEKNWYGQKDEYQTGQDFTNRLSKIDKVTPKTNLFRIVESKDDVIVNYNFNKIENNLVKDNSKNGYDAKINNLEINNGKVVLDGKGYINLPFTSIGYPYTAQFDLNINDGLESDTILFDGKDGTLFLNYKNTGKVGFERKGYSFVFPFVLPENIDLKISLVCDGNNTTLYVNQNKIGVAKLYNENIPTLSSTSFVLPVEKIGSGVSGTFDNLIVYNRALSSKEITGMNIDIMGNIALNKPAIASEVEGGYLLDEDGKPILDENGNPQLRYPQFDPKHAVDGDPSTRISLEAVNDAWFVIDLEKTYAVDTISIDFNQLPSSYTLQVSEDGINYRDIETKANLPDGKSVTHNFKLKNNGQVRYVKYQQNKMFDSGAGLYSGNFTEIRVLGIDGSEIEKNIITAKEALATIKDNDEAKNFYKHMNLFVDELEEALLAGNTERIVVLNENIKYLVNRINNGNIILEDANTKQLEELINEKIDLEAYMEDGVNEYKNIVSYAKLSLELLEYNQHKINVLCKTIENAKDKLILDHPLVITTNFDLYTNPSGHCFDPMYLVDGDLNTIMWSIPNQRAGQTIQFKFSKPIKLSSINIFASQDGMDIPQNAHFEISKKGTEWVNVGSIEADCLPNKKIVFEETEVKYVRLVIDSDENIAIRLAEIKFNDKKFIDKTKLEAEIKVEVDSDEYTEESYQIYYDALTLAKKVVESDNTNQLEIHSVTNTLIASRDALIKKVVIPVERIELNTANRVMIIGDTFDIKATVKPENATNKNLSYKSSDESIVSVNKEGRIEALTFGKATLIVSVNDDEIKKEFTVEVVNPATIIINNNVITVGENFDPFVGIQILDVDNTNITKNAKIISNNVNSSKVGTYTIIYEVIDKLGNKVRFERLVKVKNTDLEVKPPNSQNNNLDVIPGQIVKTGDNLNVVQLILICILVGLIWQLFNKRKSIY